MNNIVNRLHALPRSIFVRCHVRLWYSIESWYKYKTFAGRGRTHIPF